MRSDDAMLDVVDRGNHDRAPTDGSRMPSIGIAHRYISDHRRHARETGDARLQIPLDRGAGCPQRCRDHVAGKPNAPLSIPSLFIAETPYLGGIGTGIATAAVARDQAAALQLGEDISA